MTLRELMKTALAKEPDFYALDTEIEPKVFESFITRLIHEPLESSPDYKEEIRREAAVILLNLLKKLNADEEYSSHTVEYSPKVAAVLINYLS